jgi:thymidylate synthase (FAD)
MHIADMRAAGDAQWEIREMTKEVLTLARQWMPYTFEYYKENLMNRKNRLAP